MQLDRKNYQETLQQCSRKPRRQTYMQTRPPATVNTNYSTADRHQGNKPFKCVGLSSWLLIHHCQYSMCDS